jgi:hypothetical protein
MAAVAVVRQIPQGTQVVRELVETVRKETLAQFQLQVRSVQVRAVVQCAATTHGLRAMAVQAL